MLVYDISEACQHRNTSVECKERLLKTFMGLLSDYLADDNTIVYCAMYNPTSAHITIGDRASGGNLPSQAIPAVPGVADEHF